MNFDAIAGRYSYRAGESYPNVSRGERTTHPARPRSRSRPATRHSRPVAAPWAKVGWSCCSESRPHPTRRSP